MNRIIDDYRRRTDEGEGYTVCDADVMEAERERLQRDPKVGLALSGGGIRSASVSIGVLQALSRHDILKDVDYISTVSGGGYTGSALTWWLGRSLPELPLDGPFDTFKGGTNVDNFPFGAFKPEDASAGKRTGKAQFAILDFLRFHSSYLLPGQGLDLLSIVALVLRNILLSMIIHLSGLTIVLFIVFLVPVTVGTYWDAVDGDELVSPIVIHAFSGWVTAWLAELPVREPISVIVSVTFLHCAFYAGCVFLAVSGMYALGTLVFQRLQTRAPKGNWGEIRYTLRIGSQRLFGWLLRIFLVAMLLGIVPTLHALSDSRVLFTAILVCVALILMFTPFTSNVFNIPRGVDRVQRTAGAWLFLAMVLFVSYSIALECLKSVLEVVEELSVALAKRGESEEFIRDLGSKVLFMMYSTVGLLSVIVFGIVGRLVNVNYLGIHRMYRDRLMELFLPDKMAVETQKWNPSRDANKALIEEMCPKEAPRPYHLINANVVLVDSKRTKYRERGGANFILSPLFCGSEATGWRRSRKYMKRTDPGMTLGTAMAISGAAANPYAGGGGSGWTRNRAVSIAMSMLSLRLGYWAPNPNPTKDKGEIPNFISPSITAVFVLRRLHEGNAVLDLTDGGHFENLGLYELIRRELDTIIVCDASADPRGEYVSLATAIGRARVDFRATIEFPDDGYGLAGLKAEERGGDTVDVLGQGANRGFAVGRIVYRSGAVGRLIYVKPTLTKNLGPEAISYSRRSPRFPHESTADQFFDEQQFEVYRELGEMLGDMAAPQIRDGRWEGKRWNPSGKEEAQPQETPADGKASQ